MARASPLQPQERRAAIIAATERLIVAQGGNVSTRAIAEAAGIAEGTIFRVFPTKEDIIDAVFEDAFDREGYRAQLAAIDLGADLKSRMTEAVGIMQRRILRIMMLFTALGFGRPSLHEHKSRVRREQGFLEIVPILEPDRDNLRLPPIDAARLLQAMVMAQSLPMLGGGAGGALSPEELVDLILYGVARHPAVPTQHRPSTESPSC